METPQLYSILNLRKPVSHITFLVFSFLTACVVWLLRKNDTEPFFSFGVFIMLFVQLEVFIYLGSRLFADLNFDKSPGEITRIVITRFIIFMTGCLLVSMLLFIILQYVGLIISGGDVSNVLSNFINIGFRKWLTSTLKGLLVGGVIFIFLLWQASLKREQKLREEKLIFQNETLKSQVNPHFLFNSLNTLSSLIPTQPDVAEEFTNRLSAIYRYILEYSSRDRVPLNVELSFINDYFFLHKIRDDGKIQLHIDISENENSEILPVSLQILIENAVKHNKATRESPLIISIYIENKFVVVKNNLQRMSGQMLSTRIGLKNLSQRVNLVSRKALIVEEKQDEFIVKIPLL